MELYQCQQIYLLILVQTYRLFFFDNNTNNEVILINASNLGKVIKVGKSQKTLLSTEDEKMIIDTFKKKRKLDNFSVKVSVEDIIKRRFSFSAGQYFDIKVEYKDISEKEIMHKIKSENSLNKIFLNKNINKVFFVKNRLINFLMHD